MTKQEEIEKMQAEKLCAIGTSPPHDHHNEAIWVKAQAVMAILGGNSDLEAELETRELENVASLCGIFMIGAVLLRPGISPSLVERCERLNMAHDLCGDARDFSILAPGESRGSEEVERALRAAQDIQREGLLNLCQMADCGNELLSALMSFQDTERDGEVFRRRIQRGMLALRKSMDELRKSTEGAGN